LSIIRKQPDAKAPDWQQLQDTDGLLPGVKNAFGKLQMEILVAIAMAPVKQAQIYCKMSHLLSCVEKDFSELLRMSETVRKKPLSAATEQEHKVNNHL